MALTKPLHMDMSVCRLLNSGEVAGWGVRRGETGSEEDNKSIVREGLRPLSLFCMPKQGISALLTFFVTGNTAATGGSESDESDGVESAPPPF